MNELTMNGDKRMTVREVAEALNVSEQTIRYWVRKQFPDIVENGKTTLLNGEQCTAIKRLIGTGRNDLDNITEVSKVTTDIEMAHKAADVIRWAMSKIGNLETELSIAKPKAFIADRISSAEGLKSLSEVGKINGIGPRKIFDILSNCGILYRYGKNWVPYQQYVDSGYFVVRESTYEMNGVDHLYSKTYVTGKGEIWLAKQLFKNE